MKKAKLKSTKATERNKSATSAISSNTPDTPKTDDTSFPIVAIGASAGGLEAFKQLFSSMPPTTGMAFILIQHLDPKHESLAAEILERTTQMPVIEVHEGMPVQPNHVYVIPPNTDMAIFKGVLSLLPRSITRGLHLPIDFFFQSLAEDQKTRAIGVVLSGTASDGTQGLKVIKAEGGITCAQAPESAKYDAMPKNAIASGIVDIVLPPAQLAAELARLARHPYLATLADIASISLTADSEIGASQTKEITLPADPMRQIFFFLRKQMQVDFSDYKLATLQRRIQRRMVVTKKEDLQSYAQFLRNHPEEVRTLYADVLIHVTSFFRNAESFKALKEHIFPKLIKDRASEVPLRVWVIGCSTGEEAYSLAIALFEFLGDAVARNPVQIFATDISETAIQKARAGIYSTSSVKELSKERLNRFFDKVEDGYKITKSIRDCCLFTRHDVTRDPPFAKLDLVSCRNLLIYFNSDLQKRIIPVLHYTLNPGGILWLGRSESLNGFPNLFIQVDKIHKIYSKTGASKIIHFQLPLKSPLTAYTQEEQALVKSQPSTVRTELDFEKDADQIIVSQYAPSGVIIDQEMNILQFRGRVVPYLEPLPGEPSHSLLKMVRSELLPSLRMAIQRARKQGTSERQEGLTFEQDKKHWTANIQVTPINPLAPDHDRRFLVLFEEVPSLPSVPQVKLRGKKLGEKQGLPRRLKGLGALNQQIAQLQKELKDTLEYQKSLSAEYETTQEELTASNEELQSTNEELQSSNEELETAKEELQSTNEELTTVNDELQSRNVDLTRSSNDLNNLLSSTDIPIVMIGLDRRIRKFTPKAGKALNLIASDLGRPIGDIKPNFDLDIDALASEVIHTVTTKEVEVQDRHGQWNRVQIRPYNTIDHKIDGAVLAIVDIGELKLKLKSAATALSYTQTVADTVQLPLVVIDHQMDLSSANASFYEHFRLSKQLVGQSFLATLGLPNSKTSPLYQLIADTLTGQAEFTKFELAHEFSGIGHRTILFSGRQIHWVPEISGAPETLASILVSLEDVTEQRKTEAKLALESANVRLFEALATASNEVDTIPQALQIFLDQICTYTAWPVGHAFLVPQNKFDGNLTGNLKDSQDEFISTHAWHLEDPNKFASFKKQTEQLKLPLGEGLPGKVWKSRSPVLIRDLSSDPPFCRGKVALEVGLNSALAFPVIAGDATVAIMEFYSTKNQEPDRKLIDILTHVIPQLGRVIERKQAERDRAQLLLSEKKARLEAERGNQAKDLFLATLSHELRTPLTAILSWAQMIRMGRLDAEKSKRGIEMIEQCAKAQNQLINDLLDVSRIMMDKLPLDLHPVDPAEVVRTTVDLIRPAADKKSIQIETTINPSVGFIAADPVRLQQIIWNILINAIKFSSEGQRIDLQLDQLEEATTQYARIKVSDQGKGMSPKFLPQLFTRFSQADSSSIRVHGGLGLGLALVRHLVELHGGTVEAESPGEGQGATFIIKIPILIDGKSTVQGSQSETPLEVASGTPLEEEPIRLDRLRVLLVEDEDNTREALTAMLSAFGAEIKAAASASEALEILPNFKPHVLVSDIAMPGEDGYSLIRKVRALGKEEARLPSLALTAYAGGEDVKRAMDAGFQAHMAKPIDAKKLVGAIARLAGRQFTWNKPRI